MRYLLPLMLMLSSCAHNKPVPTSNTPSVVGLNDILIEIQNNLAECAVRVWTRAVDEPLFEAKGKHGETNCKIYAIHNPKPEVNE